jgi:hypothetical protein
VTDEKVVYEMARTAEGTIEAIVANGFMMTPPCAVLCARAER